MTFEIRDLSVIVNLMATGGMATVSDRHTTKASFQPTLTFGACYLLEVILVSTEHVVYACFVCLRCLAHAAPSEPGNAYDQGFGATIGYRATMGYGATTGHG